MEFIKQRWQVFLLLFSMVVIGSSLGLVLRHCHDSGREAYIKSWDYGKYAIGKCVLGSQAIAVENCMGGEPGTPCKPDPSYESIIQGAIQIWTKRLGEKHSSIFYRGTRKGTSVRGRKLYHLRLYSSPTEYGETNGSRVCGRHLWGADPTIQDGRFGYGMFYSNPAYDGSYIGICKQKIEEVWTRKRSKAASWLRAMGRQGIIAHEIGHFLIGPRHTDPYGSLMATAPVNASISDTTLEIAKNGIDSCLERDKSHE